MIQHTVAFRLHHDAGSDKEKAFLHEVKQLQTLPGVLRFKLMRQVGKKNSFTWGLSMHFSSQQSYDAYNSHPDHVNFVDTVWLPEVADFMEIDYIEETA
ncbi:MAG: Dabb family protein [Granulosicoccus sp.]